jgi:uroporphyrinogen decarboxylase
MTTPANCRDRFLRALRCEPVDRPPVWIMRQAGRHLPEYRALKEDYSFHELVQTPELAREVTMQPIRRYGMDAAIIFSDILVIPEALGQPYGFRDVGGIEMEFQLETEDDVARLDPDGISEKLAYVAEAVSLIAEDLDGERALIGFGGSPWTLATYMIEGESSRHYLRSREWFYARRELFDRLLEKITAALIDYFRMKIDAGADAIQIFDSWGGVLAPDAFVEASTQWMRQIVEAIGDRVPVIVFSKNMHGHLDALVDTGANVQGVSWTADIAEVRAALPEDVGVQGNLDPVVPNTTPEITERETRKILEAMRGHRGFVFNLGHGITPRAKPENVARLVETVQDFE